MSDSAEAAQIRQQMAAIRREVQIDVGEIVEDAGTLLSWRYYLRRHPWLCLMGASIVGFLLVPKRAEIVSPDVETLEKLAKKNRLVIQSKPMIRARGGVGGAVFQMVAKALFRAGISYLSQQSARVCAPQPGPPSEARTGTKQ